MRELLQLAAGGACDRLLSPASCRECGRPQSKLACPTAGAKHRSFRTLLAPGFLLLVAQAVVGQTAAQTASLVLRGGNIVTMDSAKPAAQAIAVSGDRIIAVGSDSAIRSYVGPSTKVIDLAGQLAVPGFIEGHGHFTGIGRARMGLNLSEAKGWLEIVATVARSARRAKPGEWIVGRGWHQEKWKDRPSPSVEGFPVHDSLSEASPNNPVLLTHASGHASFANAQAMKRAGVTKSTVAPAGGVILKDSKGNPTGLFNERAQTLITRAMSEDLARRSAAEIDLEAKQEIDLAVEECLAKGITSFQDAGSSPETIALIRRRVAAGTLGIRLWMMIRTSIEDLERNAANYRAVNLGDHRLTVRAVKRTMDGALGSRGAWLLAPYSDLPGSSGLNTESVEDVERVARIALRSGFQLCVHAIGDRANRETLNVFERVAAGRKDLRWRIEHAQHLSTADIPRFGALGVIAAMQGVHCTSDAPYVVERLGAARAGEGAYVWKKLLASGAVIGNGTDAPVEDVDPIASFHATVTRSTPGGAAFYPAQRLTREEALRSFTLSNAYAAFEEDIKGSLVPGKLADITVLTRNIMTVPDDEIRSARVAYTIVGGKVMYKK